MQNKEENHQSFRWNDCLIKLSFFLQFLSFVLSGIAFFAPFWYIELNSEIREGLWGRCDKLLECIWFHERSFEQSLPGEYIVAGCCGFDSHHSSLSLSHMQSKAKHGCVMGVGMCLYACANEIQLSGATMQYALMLPTPVNSTL